VKNLLAMGSARGAKAVFARHGSKSGLEALLPGVKVHVLGPPDLTQTEKIRRMRSSDPDQFWQLTASSLPLQAQLPAARGRGKRGVSATQVPPEARWFRDRMAALGGDQLLEIVRALDEQMNNTSLILLFEVGGKKLLFSGDAQIESWSYALQDAPDAAATRALLRQVDLYKVGHHGSRNATPRKLLWEAFAKRRGTGGRGLVSLLSTMAGKHGTASRQTEVPRKTLVAALEAETQLHRTDGRSEGETAGLCETVVLKI